MDMQTLAVVLCVLAAVLFMGRKMYKSLRKGGGGCGCGCSCGEGKAGRRTPSCCAGQMDDRKGP